MANLSGFDANTVEPNKGFEPIPAGDYDAIISESEMKPTKDGAGQYLKLKLQIINGQFQNRVLFENLNLKNSSEQAVQIAKGNLSAICRAVGVLTPQDSCELHNKPMTIRVKVATDDDGNKQNRIVSYKPRQSGGVPTAASAPTVSGKPW